MMAEQPNGWVRFWAGPEPTSDPKLTLRRVFRKMGLIGGLVLAAGTFFMMWEADEPLWLKLVISLAVFLFMFGVFFGLGLLMGHALLFVVGDKRDTQESPHE